MLLCFGDLQQKIEGACNLKYSWQDFVPASTAQHPSGVYLTQSILAWKCCPRHEKRCYDSWSAPLIHKTSVLPSTCSLSFQGHERKYAAVAPSVHLGWTFFESCQTIWPLTISLWFWNCKASTKTSGVQAATGLGCQADRTNQLRNILNF